MTQTTLGLVAKLRDHAALQEHGVPPKNIAALLRDAADDLDRTRYHLAMVLCEYTDINNEVMPAHVNNALDYYSARNPDAQVKNDEAA
jgi:hypothetical protein